MKPEQWAVIQYGCCYCKRRDRHRHTRPVSRGQVMWIYRDEMICKRQEKMVQTSLELRKTHLWCEQVRGPNFGSLSKLVQGPSRLLSSVCIRKVVSPAMLSWWLTAGSLPLKPRAQLSYTLRAAPGHGHRARPFDKTASCEKELRNCILAHFNFWCQTKIEASPHSLCVLSVASESFWAAPTLTNLGFCLWTTKSEIISYSSQND